MRRFLVAAALLVAPACEGPDAPSPRLSLVETLGGGDTAGYTRALEPGDFDFPLDHGPHPDFRTEWWYVTGNVTSATGRDYGFQLTIFRSALAPSPPSLESAWATNQAYMAHLAVTDVANGRFHAFERFSRGALGVAGAEASPLRVWLEDWELASTTPDSTFPLGLSARSDGVSVRLALRPAKPLVLQGDRGLSPKSDVPGNASYYYSFTRLEARGSIALNGEEVGVSGAAWLDREWSTSALGPDQLGWDWFALQLDDGWDLMIYRLRLTDGSADATSAGVLVGPDGTKRSLVWGTDVSLESTGTWASPLDGAEYPSGWHILLPERGWDLTVEPRLRNQELDLAFRYWEGAVSVTGRGEAGAPVTGRGYAELTGYAGTALQR